MAHRASADLMGVLNDSGGDRNSLGPRGALGPCIGTNPELKEDTYEPWAPLERCLGSTTLTAPRQFGQVERPYVGKANILFALGATPQELPCLLIYGIKHLTYLLT